MSVFSQPEWANFVRVCRKKPWHCFGYVLELARLVARRFANTLHIKLVGKSHRGLKRWPEWLITVDSEVDHKQDELAFPIYLLSSRPRFVSELPELQFAANDVEGYFAEHRWMNCFLAALESDDVAKAALGQSLSWIRAAPGKEDAAWETYSSCERVVNLAVMLAAHPYIWSNLDAERKRDVANFLAESASWISSHLEYYGIARTNNHILNNARALVVVGAVLGDVLLVERGLFIFSRMAKELFQPGGFLRERSSHYQYVVSNWLLDTLHFARMVPISCEQACIAISELEKLAVRVIAATSLLDGALEGLNTHIGDISPDNHPVATTLRLKTLYPKFFSETGLYADKRQDDWLFVSTGQHQLITCGMPAEYPFNYTTHGHPDLGSFIWGYSRHPILVDAGRSSYGFDEATKLQCSPIGHNVITVNGLSPLSESLLTQGLWRPSPYAKAAINLEHKSAQGFVLTHDGFSRIPDIKVHTRAVKTVSAAIEIVDTLDGSGLVDIDMYWHFAPGVSLIQASPYIAAGNNFQILIDEDGVDAADVHWEAYPYAAAYGDVQHAFMLHSRRTVSLPWSVKTIMKVMQCAE